MSVSALPSRTCLHQLVKKPSSKASREPQQKHARALQYVHRQSLGYCSGHARRVSLLLLQPSSCLGTVSCQAQEILQTDSLKCVSDRRKSQLQHELIDANRGIFGIKVSLLAHCGCGYGSGSLVCEAAETDRRDRLNYH